MKTYVLTVSRVFPTTHKRKGERTYFPEKILSEIIPCGLISKSKIEDFEIGNYDFNLKVFNSCQPKLHTIRANYPLWEKRIKEVQEGKAILSIRYWSGKPYNSKQVEICQLDKDSGVGVQKIMFNQNDINFPKVDDGLNCFWVDVKELSKNDGLTFEDFKEWFKGYDLSSSMAIIHFTNFRY